VEADGIIIISVMEGDSVTLHTDVTSIQRNDHITWKFGSDKSCIAEVYNQIYTYPDADERFRDRLKLHPTGSLTITNTRLSDSGYYTVSISSSRRTLRERFMIIVNGELNITATLPFILYFSYFHTFCCVSFNCFCLRRVSPHRTSLVFHIFSSSSACPRDCQ